MTTLIAALVLQVSVPPVVEWLEPKSSVTSIQVVVNLPELNAKDRALLRIVASTTGEGSVSYGPGQLDEIFSRTGARIRTTLGADHLRMSGEVVPADLPSALNMLASLLKEPTASPERLQAASDDLQFRRLSWWRQALNPTGFIPPRYSSTDLASLRARVFRPERIHLAVGGKLQPGLATSKWTELMSAWQVPKISQVASLTVVDEKPEYDGELSIAPFSGRDAALSTRLLALTALGTGKSALLWEVARDELRFSYRQESVLTPTPTGFQLRLLIAHSGTEELAEKADQIQKRLIERINVWTEEDRKRALAMADAFLVRESDLSPLYFSGGAPLGRSLADQTFLRAYWPMKTGASWNPHQLVGRMGFVELADLKNMALDLVSKSDLRILKGK